MSGEAEALGKILDGIKELGKSFVTEASRSSPKQPPPPNDVWRDATKQPPGTYAIPRILLDELKGAWEDDDIMKHVPMGMARPVVRVLSHVYPEIT